ncbi:MAG: GNAT family N-acetyltransferase [Gemmataceae bacterium]|nr:GNAT family N-acetyltransferase [Gemmataceae bacterium]
MPPKVVVETARMFLREFDEADAPVFYQMCTDPEVTRFTGDGMVLQDVEHARRVLCERPIADYQKHGFGRWACVLKASGQVIGFVGLKFLEELQEVDIGYRLFPAHWGQGLATEAARAALRYGFEQLGLKRIIGLVDPQNAVSVRVLEKLSMRPDGIVNYYGKPTLRFVLEADDGRVQ